MRKKLLGVLIILILVGSLFNAFVNPADAATPRDSSYKFDVLAEHVRLLLTFNKDTKIQLAWEYADEKLAEIEFEQERIWEATRAELYYKKYIRIALNLASEGELSPETTQAIQTIFANHSERIVTLYDTAPVYTKFIPVDIAELFFEELTLIYEDLEEDYPELVELPEVYEEEHGDVTFPYEDVGPIYTDEPDPIVDDILLDEEDIPEPPVEPPVDDDDTDDSDDDDEEEDTDIDDDGIDDDVDNCPDDANADQLDSDGDGEGDLCDDTPFPPQGGDSEVHISNYFGGMGLKLGIANAVEYIDFLESNGVAQPQSCQGNNAGGPGGWIKDPEDVRKVMRACWNGQIRIPGFRYNVQMYRIPVDEFGRYPDQQIAEGVWDEYLTWLGQELAVLEAEMIAETGDAWISITPMHEAIGGIGRPNVTAHDEEPPYRNGTEAHWFHEAFERIITLIGNEVEIDHVVLHLNAHGLQTMETFIPPSEWWDSYGVTVAFAADKQGHGDPRPLPSESYRSMWANLVELGYDKTIGYSGVSHTMSFPEWKQPDGFDPNNIYSGGVLLESNWPRIQDVFDLIEAGDVPISLITWDNKDPAQIDDETGESKWGYGELRWQFGLEVMQDNWIRELKAIR